MRVSNLSKAEPLHPGNILIGYCAIRRRMRVPGDHPDNVMTNKQIVMSMVLGCAMIAIGLIPGLIAHVRDSIQNFQAELQGLPPVARTSEDAVPGQIWFAIAGFALAMCGVAALLTR